MPNIFWRCFEFWFSLLEYYMFYTISQKSYIWHKKFKIPHPTSYMRYNVFLEARGPHSVMSHTFFSLTFSHFWLNLCAPSVHFLCNFVYTCCALLQYIKTIIVCVCCFALFLTCLLHIQETFKAFLVLVVLLLVFYAYFVFFIPLLWIFGPFFL